MATLRELKGRIGSVASSEKITGAMKMISSAKMHKAELSLKRLLPFRSQIESIIGNLLTADADFTSPLTETREVRNVSIVVFGSDDGLCGAYNVNIFKQLRARMAGSLLRPRTIVDYTREAFVFGPGDVRITLDYGIRTGLAATDLLDPDCVTVPVPGDPLLLEVKWGAYLPDVIRDAVQLPGRRTEAFSKYAACRQYG